ncbi:MAG TPA: GNAT family N-acetyltransferase [Steroidobacteraceae bacterium]|nr:GNAT family N-acetyltransferase [Steroidobacteraceae bacterium]
MVVIRPAKLSDAASLAAVAEQTFRETFAADNSAENINLHCAQKFSTQIQGEEISDPQLVTLLADIAGELVGFAQLRLAHSTTCVKGDRPAELHRIYVSSKWHGRGVANELMRAIYSVAAKAGSDCLWLGVWEKNLKAIAFYRKCGFSVLSDHVFMLGQDQQRDLIMEAHLGSLSSVA